MSLFFILHGWIFSGQALYIKYDFNILMYNVYGFYFSFCDFYLFIFREREREGEKHQCVVVSRIP